jgi:hypothetical protein
MITHEEWESLDPDRRNRRCEQLTKRQSPGLSFDGMRTRELGGRTGTVPVPSI